MEITQITPSDKRLKKPMPDMPPDPVPHPDETPEPKPSVPNKGRKSKDLKNLEKLEGVKIYMD